MQRILLILALAVLLFPAKHSTKDNPVVAGALLVRSEAVPLVSGTAAAPSLGPFIWRGSWVLRSDSKDFGGISAMLVSDDQSVLALADSATLMGFPAPSRPHSAPARRQFIAPLPIKAGYQDWPNWKWDSESLVHDPVSDRYWVGFEMIDWICRYSPGFSRVESCRVWPEMLAWPKTGGAEAMVRLTDGRFLIFSEMAYGGANANQLLLFAADPTEQSTPRPQMLTYRPPQGFRPTDAVQIAPNRLLVLNRRVTLYQGFTASIAVVDMPPLKEGAHLVGREIARLEPPVLSDNYEALALSKENGRTMLWVASDDNLQFFQRTLLLKLQVPDSLLRN